MAITAATKLSDFSGFIDAEVAGPIFEGAAKQSTIQRVAERIPMSYKGVDIPVVTGRPQAAWVNEAGQKAATNGGMELVTMSPKKIAAIAVVSEEVVRANPGGYVDWLYPALSSAFAIAFDFAAIHGLGGNGTGTGPFTADLADTTKTVTFNTGATYWNDIMSAAINLADEGRDPNGLILAPVMKYKLMNEVDSTNRPIFVSPDYTDSMTARIGGFPATFGEAVGIGTTVGFLGDFNKCKWGAVGGINFSVSNEASVTINGSLQSLFEYNLVAIRAEAEYGFVMTEPDNFVKFIKPSDLGTLDIPGFATP